MGRSEVPLDLAPGDPPIDVQLRWCEAQGGGSATDGTLAIDSNAVLSPTLTLDLVAAPNCPDGS